MNTVIKLENMNEGLVQHKTVTTVFENFIYTSMF